jgi:cobalt/nickel transport system ATP-binding protein
MEKIVKVNCLEHIYPDKTKVELCGLEFCIEKGEKIALLGSNGAGKTTLIKHLLGLLKPNKGEVSVFGYNPFLEFDKIRTKIGAVFQDVETQLIGPTVIEDVMFTPLNYGIKKDEAYQKSEKIMKKLGIWELKDKVIHYLSGGEKRKVALAGALVLEPELLILDEPFSGLDRASIKDLINLINKTTEENPVSWLISTHDLELVAQFADTLYLVSKNTISQKVGVKEGLTNIKLLEEYHLEAPCVVELFSNFQTKNEEFLPTTVEEAISFIKNNFELK